MHLLRALHQLLEPRPRAVGDLPRPRRAPASLLLGGAALLLKPPLLRRAALFCKSPLFRTPPLLGRAALFRKPLLFRKPPLLLGAAPPFRLGGIRPGLAVAAAILTKPEKSQESRSRGEKKGTGKGGHVLEKQPCADVGDV